MEKNPEPLDANPWRFCGEYFDREAETLYLRARNYDSKNGRMLGEDSVRSVSQRLPNDQKLVDPLSLNLYTYCHNNPIMYIDSSGCSAEWIFALRRPIIALDIGKVVQGKDKTNISTNTVRFATNDLGLAENEVREGSQTNAFRHALWTATISNKYGAGIAREAVNSHEEWNIPSLGRAIKDFSETQIPGLAFSSLSEADGIVDYLNNEIALQMGWDETIPMNEIALAVLELYHNTGLWVAFEHEDGSYRIQKDILWNEQYDVAKARLGLLDKDGFAEGQRKKK